MLSPVTGAEFIDRVRKSGLCSDERLDAYFGRAAARRDDGHAGPIADEMVRAGLLTSFQAKQVLEAERPDFLIGEKYRILDLLGRGGMGSVFLCEHVRLRRLAAVKVLPRDKERDLAALARFEREAQAVAALNHPNIVRAYDIDHAGGRHFLAMEFIDGVDLHTLVARHGPLAPRRAAHCVRQCALGLHHAYLAGWVHRDVKPGNLLLDRRGNIKVLDLGLARIFDARRDSVTSLFDERHILGTADYISPEQAAGQSEVDVRSDVYSLGATFYFLLTGRAPFEDSAVSHKLHCHRNVDPVPVRERRPEVPDGIAAIVTRMLAKQPEDRYATPGEVAEALESFCTPPPESPAENELPQWSPAVADRIQAAQGAPPDLAPAPQTAPLPIPPIPPRTSEFDIVLPARPGQRRPWRTLRIPAWLAAIYLLVLLGTDAWVIWRQTRPVPADPPELRLPVLAPDQAAAHADEFVCVEFDVRATETRPQLRLFAGPANDANGFFVQLESAAVAGGELGAATPEKVADLFRNHRVRVVGRVNRAGDGKDPAAPHIKVNDSKQIQVIGG
jgi:serine/threonine protein kinase